MSFSVNKEIAINANPAQVWATLTTPKLIKQYLFGTDTVSDWKEGSSIVFQGSYEGTSYEDKGVILVFDPEKIFKYSYFSSFSTAEDKPENYSMLTFELTKNEDSTTLSLTQDNILTKEGAEHSTKSWEMVLEQLKSVAENVSA